MKRILTIAALALMAASAIAQSDAEPFKGNLSNDEYKVYINFDFHGSGINVPGHEILAAGIPCQATKQFLLAYHLGKNCRERQGRD